MRFLKKTYKLLSDYRYHFRQKKTALLALKNIEEEKGKLSKYNINLCNEYASDVLGSYIYSPWLYVYTAINGSFREGWIPDNYYGKVLLPKIKGEYGLVSEIKGLSKKLFPSGNFPDILYVANGNFFNTCFEPIKPLDLERIIFKFNDLVIYKSDLSSQGRGILLFERASFSLEQFLDLGNGVVQSYICQHEFFSQFTNRSVATIRLTTAINSELEVSLRAAYLRLGGKSDRFVKSDSHIRIPIDLVSGDLYTTGFFPTWKTTHCYPNGQDFNGLAIPCFQKCVDTVVTLHKTYPYIKCIGWDVVVDNNENVIIMEWNGAHNDIKFSEATQGPCFKELNW